jgi:hypothetical protein
MSSDEYDSQPKQKIFSDKSKNQKQEKSTNDPLSRMFKGIFGKPKSKEKKKKQLNDPKLDEPVMYTTVDEHKKESLNDPKLDKAVMYTTVDEQKIEKQKILTEGLKKAICRTDHIKEILDKNCSKATLDLTDKWIEGIRRDKQKYKIDCQRELQFLNEYKQLCDIEKTLTR